MPKSAQAEAPRRPSILTGHSALPGVPDELLREDGTLRPEWVSLIAHLDGLSPDERDRAFARGAQYLRDAGVFVRHYGEEKSPRDWPLSPIPVIQAVIR